MNRYEPATKIIEVCGGPQAVARMTERNVTSVYRWRLPEDRDGTGGVIPMDAAIKLMHAARERGIGLKPEHFFPEG